MRILIVADTFYPHVNGASYFTQRLAHYLHLKGHTVGVIAPSEEFAHTHTQETFSVYGIRSVPVLMYEGFRFTPPFFIKKRLDEIISPEGFDPEIIHLQGHFMISRSVLKVAQKKNIPVVATNHFMPENLSHYLPLPKKVIRFIERLAWEDFGKVFSKVAHVSTPTKTAASLIRYRLPEHPEAISCGIDLERFKPENDGAYLRDRYRLPAGRPVLLYVGRLDKEKNVDMVLRAVARAVENVDLHFVVAGTGHERPLLERLVDELGIREYVTFAGFVPDEDLPNLYAMASCFVIAGIAELQCIVAMEAMATGLPMLAMNAVALPELVHHEENGFLFELGDVETLATQIETLFSNEPLRKEMGKKSLEIISHHDINKTTAAFEAVYEQVLRRKSL